ncbi:MAG TPA: hypothetical protein VF791_07180 [Pyrinomonadaceae bacterium]
MTENNKLTNHALSSRLKIIFGVVCAPVISSLIKEDKMRKILLFVLALTAALPLTAAQTPAQDTSSTAGGATTRVKQEQLIGEVTAIDAATGQVTLKTDAGKIIYVSINEQTSYLRIAPGEKSLTNAAQIARTDVAIGDRVLVRHAAGIVAVEGQPVLARQLIVISKQSLAGREERNREDWRRRGVAGRVIALNPETKEITITARAREGVETVILNASGNVKLLHYAPDSVRQEDAQPISFADLKVGDQLRARGDRSADGTRFTAEEIIAGSFTRAMGTITDVDAAKNEVKIKDEQSGKTLIVIIGKNSTLRRIPADLVERLEQRRAEQQQRRASREGSPNAQPAGERRERRRAEGGQVGENGERRPRGGPGGGGAGGNFQQLLEGLPVITVAELKKGDMVLVNGTPASDASRLTAITITTGDAALMKRLQQFQGRPNGQRNMSPGLPADAVGGGSGSERERPQ